MISCFFFRKEDNLQGWKSILCWNVTSLEEGKWLVFLPKDPKYNGNQRGGKKNYDNGDYDDDDDDYDDYDDDHNDYNVRFFIPTDLKQGWHQGEQINYDDDDEIDDNDNNDDDDDDDDDDNNDGHGVFFLHKDFFVGIYYLKLHYGD